MTPTTNDSPFRYVSVLCLSNDPFATPSRSNVDGAPIGAYPPAAVEESGNSVLPKSKAEDIEYDRPPDLPYPDSGSPCEKSPSGSCSSSESLREDDIPEGEEEREDLAVVSGDEDAREASSRESRGALVEFDLPGRDEAIMGVCRTNRQVSSSSSQLKERERTKGRAIQSRETAIDGDKTKERGERRQESEHGCVQRRIHRVAISRESSSSVQKWSFYCSFYSGVLKPQR